MDLDQQLRAGGERWRAAQPPLPSVDIARLVTGATSPTRYRPLALVAAAAAVVVALVLVLHGRGAPAEVPAGPTPQPSHTSSSVRAHDLVGTWYATVSITKTRTQHQELVGRWVLVLGSDGQARLSQTGQAATAVGRWSLDQARMTLDLPLPGCSGTSGQYTVWLSTIHAHLLEIVPVHDADPCLARALVLGNDWFTTPTPPG